jgi:hypothetical protein
MCNIPLHETKNDFMKMQVSAKVAWCVGRVVAMTILISAALGSSARAETYSYDFHGTDTSSASAGNVDVTFQITGDKQGANIDVSAVEILVIDGASSATNLFAALGMYQLKPGTNRLKFPVTGVTSQPTSITITNGRDTDLPGNVWKLDLNGNTASLRTHGDAMDIIFKGSLAPKVDTATAEDSKTMYIVGGIIGAATIGTGIYLLIENGKRKERHRRRRRSLMVKDLGKKLEDV